MRHRCPMAIALTTLWVAAALAQERPTIELRYAPPAAGQRSYAAAIEGSAEVPILNLGAFPVYFDLSYDVTYGDQRDGVIEETVSYTRVAAMVLGQHLSSKYVGVPVTIRRGPRGEWLMDSEAYPPPQLLSADLFTLFGHIPRMLLLPDHPVGVGDEWSVERAPLPRLLRVGDLPPLSGDPLSPPVTEGGVLEGPEDQDATAAPLEEVEEEAEAAAAPPQESDSADAAEGEEEQTPPPAEGEDAAAEEEAAEVDATEEPQADDGEQEGELPASSTFLTQRTRLENVQEHNGRLAAILRSEMAVEMVREVFFTGISVDGRILANIEHAVYADTGELIVANVEMAAEFSVPTPFGQLVIRVPRVVGRFGEPSEITPLVADQQQRQPGGRRAGVGGGRAGVR